MRITKTALAAVVCLVPSLSWAATATVNLDATVNTANSSEGAQAIALGRLIPLSIGAGDVTVSVIDGVFQAYRFGDNPINCVAVDDCGDGWTVNWKFFDSAGTQLEAFAIPGTYASAAEALLAAQAEGARNFFVPVAGTYFFAIGDGLNSVFDNEGGVSLSVEYASPAVVPLPASGLLLLGAFGALALRTRRTRA